MSTHERGPIHYRGSDVIDPDQRLIGKIDDLVYDVEGKPIWAVVELGLMRSAHYLPVAAGYLTENGKLNSARRVVSRVSSPLPSRLVSRYKSPLPVALVRKAPIILGGPPSTATRTSIPSPWLTS